MPSDYRCALRNSKCIVCNEPYGSKLKGIRTLPVVLSCGHDLCITCGEKIKSKCPKCEKILLFPATAKLRVDYIKESKEQGKEAFDTLSSLIELVGKMSTHCDELEEEDSVKNIRRAARSLEKTTMCEISGSQLKLLMSGVMRVIVKLCDSIEERTQTEVTSESTQSHSKASTSGSEGDKQTTSQTSPATYLPTPPREAKPTRQSLDSPTRKTPNDILRPYKLPIAGVSGSAVAVTPNLDHLKIEAASRQLSPKLDIYRVQRTQSPDVFREPSYLNSIAKYEPNYQIPSSKPAKSQRRCSGITTRGERCSRTVAGTEDFCYQHTSQANTPSLTVATDGRCAGITRGGERCKNNASSSSNYCHLHDTSKPKPTGTVVPRQYTWENEAYDPPPARKTIGSYGGYQPLSPASNGGQCLGITKTGAQCKRRGTNGGYCYQHGG